MSFYDDNELIAFPLVGDDNFLIPHDVLVDCVIHAPAALGTQLAIRSMSLTDLLVSIVLTIDGTDAAYLTVPLTSVTVHGPVEVQPIQDGVSGFLAFGEGINRHNLRVDGTYRLLPECLISYQFDATNPTLAVGPYSLKGLVSLETGDGLTIEPVTMRVRNEDASITTTLVGLVTVTDVSIYDDPIPGCLRPAEGSPFISPITSINDVQPDCSGIMTLQIVNVQETPDAPTITPVIVPMGISWRDEGTPCSS